MYFDVYLVASPMPPTPFFSEALEAPWIPPGHQTEAV
jgi:hypothetical protein